MTDDEKNLTLNEKQSSELVVDTKQCNPFIFIKIKNKNTGRANYLFDSGSYDFYISIGAYSFFEKLSIFKVLGKANGSFTLGLHGAADEMFHYKLLLPTMEINGAKLSNVLIKTTAFAYSTVGTKLLELGVVTLDYKNKKFYFAPSFKKKKDLFEKSPPIEFIYRNNQLQIGIVWDKSLNDNIKVGDQIMAIDDVSIENMSVCQLNTMIKRYTNKDKVSLTVNSQTGIIQKKVIEKK